MATATPYLGDERWGPDPWCMFDYWRNPTRVGVSASRPLGQNPVLFLRHGGGGTGGDHQFVRTSTLGDTFYFVQWLIGTHPATEPARHWDVVSFTSGQQAFTIGGPVPRSNDMYFPDAARDVQRAIATLRHLGPSYGWSDVDCVGQGDSYGATALAWSQLAPPLVGSGNQLTWTERTRDPWTHSSRLKGLVFHIGQIDARVIGGQNYISHEHYAGWFGTSPFNSDSLDAVPTDIREAASIRRYFERGDLQYYPGFMAVWSEQGDHVQPFSNPHDSQQFYDLLEAAAAAGITMDSQLYIPGAYANTQWPAGPNHSALVVYQECESWMASRLLLP
jgi:hypothetical protein